MRGGDYHEEIRQAATDASTPPSRVCTSSSRRWSKAIADWVPYVMLCKNPYVKTGQAFGCGQCLPCRLNRRRIWTHRIMLEASQYKDNAFATLTYSDENLPECGSLVPRHLQLFMKRLRRKLEPQQIRYFGVGEYGEDTERPHYHLALFGFPSCQRGFTAFSREGRPCCVPCVSIQQEWPHGGISLGSLTPESAAYTAGYVTKKLTKSDDPRLNGRHPEFARMSLRPGIGGDAMHEVADVLLQYAASDGDVPTALRHGKRILPLGRYLTRRLRTMTGRAPGAPEITLATLKEKMRPLHEAAAAATSAPGMARFRDDALKTAILKENEGRISQVEARSAIFKKRGSI